MQPAKPAKPQKPTVKPLPGMFANNNGQWCKKFSSKPYYFGSWRDDPKGTAAVKDLAQRQAGILAGTDHLRHLAASGGAISVGELMGKFLAQRRLDVQAGTLSKTTYGDYSSELVNFAEWIKAGTAVAALAPEHFTGYTAHLIETRKLKSRARKRVQAYIKTMFRWGAKHVGKFPVVQIAFTSPSTTTEAIRKEKARAGLTDHSERILTGTEIDKLIGAAQPNMAAMILLGVNCGLGPADLGRMKWKHVDLERGRLRYPRHKTGNDRRGYLWKRTRQALLALLKLKYTQLAFEKDGAEALVFVTRSNQPYYREQEIVEDGKLVGIQVHNAVSITFSRLAKTCGLVGVTFYRLRHTFKTLGKKARDRDALNLCMGHKTHSVEEGYDHEEVGAGRIKRVAVKVLRRLWPTPKRQGDTSGQTPMRLAGGDGPAAAEAA